MHCLRSYVGVNPRNSKTPRERLTQMKQNFRSILGYSLFNNRFHSYWPAIGPYTCMFTHFKPPLLNSCWNTKLSQLDKMQSRVLSCQNPFYNVYPVCFKMRTCCTYRSLQIPINNISVMLFLCPGKLLEGFTHTKKYVQAYKSITILDVCFFLPFSVSFFLERDFLWDVNIFLISCLKHSGDTDTL